MVKLAMKVSKRTKARSQSRKEHTKVVLVLLLCYIVIKTIICLSGPNLGKFNDNEFVSQEQ